MMKLLWAAIAMFLVFALLTAIGSQPIDGPSIFLGMMSGAGFLLIGLAWVNERQP